MLDGWAYAIHMTSNATLHTVARHVVTCKECGTAQVFIGTRYEPNGQFYTCMTNGSSNLASHLGLRF